ncbi:MAG: hypothetical protein PUH24_06715 [Prevotellaceae bacterium]|nr:hypothetical protein [Prevotellaceae bacterium]MDY6129850.1 hypothetical protein [Prevotella sp.]
MKSTLLWVLFALTVGAKAEEKTDTVFYVKDKKVVVNVDSGQTKVQVYASNGDQLTKSYESEFVDGQQIERIYVGSPFFSKTRKYKFRPTFPLIFGGVLLATDHIWGGENTQSSTLRMRSGRSWEWGMSCFEMALPLAIDNEGIEAGLSSCLQWRFSRLEMDRKFVMNGTNEVVRHQGPELESNYVSFQSLSVPVMLDLEFFGRREKFIGVGLSVEWRSNMKSKYRYTNENNELVKCESSFPFNHWGVNLEFHAGGQNISFYARFPLTPLYKLKNGYKAYFHAVGVGIRL